MSWRRREEVRVACYPAAGSLVLKIIGGVLIAAGLLVILFCVPIWAWLAIAGATLILLGLVLIRR